MMRLPWWLARVKEKEHDQYQYNEHVIHWRCRNLYNSVSAVDGSITYGLKNVDDVWRGACTIGSFLQSKDGRETEDG